MNSQEFRALQEAYLDVYDEGYKNLPRLKMAKKMVSKASSAFGGAHKVGREGDSPETTGGQIAVKKGMKKMKQVYKMHDVATQHSAKEAKAKEASNKSPKRPIIQRSGNRVTIDMKREETDLYDIILSHLLDEGYADTEQAAQVIMVNMSEDWREEIIEGKKEFPHKKVDRQVYDAMDSGETAGDSGNRAKETRDYGRADKMRSVAAKHGGKTRG
jgi:hypothetical protein